MRGIVAKLLLSYTKDAARFSLTTLFRTSDRRPLPGNRARLKCTINLQFFILKRTVYAVCLDLYLINIFRFTQIPHSALSLKVWRPSMLHHIRQVLIQHIQGYFEPEKKHAMELIMQITSPRRQVSNSAPPVHIHAWHKDESLSFDIKEFSQVVRRYYSKGQPTRLFV